MALVGKSKKYQVVVDEFYGENGLENSGKLRQLQAIHNPAFSMKREEAPRAQHEPVEGWQAHYNRITDRVTYERVARDDDEMADSDRLWRGKPGNIIVAGSAAQARAIDSVARKRAERRRQEREAAAREEARERAAEADMAVNPLRGIY